MSDEMFGEDSSKDYERFGGFGDDLTPTEKVGSVISELRKRLEFEASSPTNEQLAKYVFDWIQSLDGSGLVITDLDAIERAIDVDFGSLRKLFSK
jgi:hypothetical protein